MMALMRHRDVQDELQEGFEVSPLPPMAPDGAPVLAPLVSRPPPRPSLCQAGPCVNYHQFAVQLDAEDPMPVTVPGNLPESAYTQRVATGTVYHAPRACHEQIHHYCYPTAGVEMRLGDMPVTACNRWVPISELVRWKQTLPEGDYSARERVRTSFLGSPDGKEYQAAVKAWEDAREAEQQQATQMEALIAERASKDAADRNATAIAELVALCDEMERTLAPSDQRGLDRLRAIDQLLRRASRAFEQMSDPAALEVAERYQAARRKLTAHAAELRLAHQPKEGTTL